MAMFVGFPREAPFWQRIRQAKDTFPVTLLKASWWCHVALADHQSFARSASGVGATRHFAAT
jgi:hypothetical protein